MKEEARTIKVYGKPTGACCKVEVREKDLEKVNLSSEWMEDRGDEEPFSPQWYEEPAEEIKVTYTPEE
ncbi:hypothetical protein A2U01_0072838, partial [Trifolium medium]|nr:hypothetical protein [Trifolium medium]